MTPLAKMKVTVPAFPHAVELVQHLLGDGRTKLGVEPGAAFTEGVAGHKLIAYRLSCGGIEVREVLPRFLAAAE